MKKRRFFSLWYLFLIALFFSQALATLGQIGSSLDDMAVYAQVQKNRSQLELQRARLMAEYAETQSLANLPTQDWSDQGYIGLSNPVSLTVVSEVSDRTLSLAQ